jgi:hypothetical protein
MKKTTQALLSCLFVLSAFTVQAQDSNIILFTENGERFTAILNGLRQNEKPETNVKVTGLNASAYKLKVIFGDAALGQFNETLYLEPGNETTYVIKKNKKNEYVVRLLTYVPIAQAPPTPPSTPVVVYNPSAPVFDMNMNVNTSETVVQQTTVTTTSGAPVNGSGVSMGVNINENGGSLSMNISAFENGTNLSSQQTSVTTTTTTTTTGYNTNSQPAPVNNTVLYVPGYSGPFGCPIPMAGPDFSSFKQSVSSKSFEDSKLTMAKQVINSNCLTAQQVKETMMLFDFETTRLDFAKYAYTRTYDIGNYYKVNDAFEFELSIDELNDYIGNQR